VGSIQVRDGGECNLSEVTASDAGGLNTNAGRKNLVHHFEMKPVLGKTLSTFIVTDLTIFHICEHHSETEAE